MESDTKHRAYRIRPSSIGTLVHCPGSLVMQDEYPDTGNEGAEGTASHHVAACLLRGETYGTTDPDGTVIDSEMVRNAELYVRYVRYVVDKNTPTIEEQIPLTAIHPTDCGGTPDATYLDATNGKLHIFDYKYGYTIVEAFNNYQCLAYASGILPSHRENYGPLEINIHIIQPRPYHPLGSIRKWVLSLDLLRKYVDVMRAAVQCALSSDPVCKPGAHCKNCTARHDCEALLYSSQDILELITKANYIGLNDEQTGRELSLLKRGKAMLDARISGLEAQVEHGLKHGKKYANWTLEPGRGKTDWAKPVEEIFSLGDLYGLDLRQNKPITPLQAKDKGLDLDALTGYTRRVPGSLKLKEVDSNYGKQFFGGK